MKKRSVYIVFFVIAIIVFLAVILFRSPKNPLDSFEFTRAVKDDLRQTVDVTGTIQPVSQVDLAFESSGRISFLSGHVGEMVNVGTLLASLDSSDLVAELTKAKAGVVSAQASAKQFEATLEIQKMKQVELEKGIRPEELAVKEAELMSAKSELLQMKMMRTNVVQSAYTQASDAVNRLTDDFFENELTDNPRFHFQTSSFVSAENMETERVLAHHTLETLSVITDSLEETEKMLQQIRSYLSKLTVSFQGVIAYRDGTSISQTTIDTYKTALKTATGNVQSTIDSITNQKNAIESKELIVARIEKEFALKKSPPTKEQIATQLSAIHQAEASVSSALANVAQAQAQVATVQSQFSKRIIRAPFTGVITKQNFKKGETATAGLSVVSLISSASFRIEASLAEVDIGQVRLGQSALVTTDAYPNETFSATVSQIDPVETWRDGVVTYRMYLELTSQDDRLKSGLTADIELMTNEKKEVLVIPQRAVIDRDGQTFVRVKGQNELIEREIITGIRAEGLVEIVSGLLQADEVVIREKK